MRVLSKLEQYDAMNVIIDENERYQGLMKTASKTFETLMQDDVNRNKGIDSQRSFIQELLKQLAIDGNTPTMVINYFGDNKHLAYFDTFAEKGETENIVKALQDNGLSPKVLRGVKHGVDLDGDLLAPNTRVWQKYERDEKGSLILVYFEIEYNGKTIYRWRKNIEELGIMPEQEEAFDEEYGFSIKEVAADRKKYKGYQQTISIPSANLRYVQLKVNRVSKKGKKYSQNVWIDTKTGKFTKNPLK